MATLRIGRFAVETSNDDKILFPDDAIEKRGLVDYYAAVAEAMLPHVRERPLMLERAPDGLEGAAFYQKHVDEPLPEFVDSRVVPKKNGRVRHVVANDPAALVYLANLAVIAFHVWLSRASALRKPDRLVFDLDPALDDFREVRRVAVELRELLEELGLAPFVQTTGSRGLHVWCPLRPEHGFDAVRDFAWRVGHLLVLRAPDRRTLEPRKDRRQGRLYIDVLRNGYAQTVVAPYSVRARAGAGVATPLAWEELDKTRRSDQYTLKSVPKRLEQLGDPWKHMQRHARSLDEPLRALSDLEKR
jgi:bifunctional non-homologous end joining protein LigD